MHSFIRQLSRSFFWCFLILLPVRLVSAQSTLTSPKLHLLDQRITQLMDSAHVPGLSIAIIQNNKVMYRKGYGLAKADSTQPVTPATIFEAASLTKPVFAYAVLQLVEEGKLDLDKPLYEYLPYTDVTDERYKQLTARLVLSHRSGFPNWRKNRQSPQLSMLFTPGKRFSYSGEGFVYLQKVVEKITNQSINELMEKRVLKPLGMTGSSFIWKPAFSTNTAQPHNELGKTETKYKPQQANMAYSLHTTVDDYTRFILAIFNHKGLTSKTIDQMLSQQSQLPNRFADSTTLAPDLFWGLGFGLEQTPTESYFWHWGDNGAFKCYVTANRSRKEAVIYFANGLNGLDFADEILKQTLGGQHPALGFLGINWREEVRKRAKAK